MSEPLSEDARVVLAFIRDHPGHALNDIARQLGIDTERVFVAINELRHRELVLEHSKSTKIVSPKVYGVKTWYPA